MRALSLLFLFVAIALLGAGDCLAQHKMDRPACPCVELAGRCACEVCKCSFVGARAGTTTIKARCPNGYEVTFVWKAEYKMYVPSEPGWTFHVDDGLWHPPVQTPQPVTHQTFYSSPFMDTPMQGCASGQCGGSGLGRRR